jgi:two-component system alkaline phosphatase synthesis response regulator PhoP
MKTSLKILAVDDNPSITGCMPFIFAAPLYEVTSATDGDDALAKLNAEPNGYDVIIVDQKMPRLNGVELVQGIRERGITGKIVVLSAHLSPEIRDAYERVGVQIVMDKPFDVEELRSVVDKTAA